MKGNRPTQKRHLRRTRLRFNFQQPSFIRFRAHYAERRRPIVFWIGAGLSTDAGLPTWRQLRERLITQALETINTLEPKHAAEAEAKLEQAARNDNLWDAFQQIKNVVKETEFRETLKHIFSQEAISTAPDIYNILWGLKNVSGMLSFNIDNFAEKSHRQMRPREDALNFVGREAKNFASAISSGRPFIANLHGLRDHYASWVFTREEIAALTSDEGYIQFINFIFTSMTVVFVGISADDIAAGGFLERLKATGLDVGPHFWITDRQDADAHIWSSRSGVEIIRYQPERDNRNKLNHAVVLSSIFEDIHKFVSRDSKPLPVVSKLNSEFKIESSRSLRNYDDDEVRQILASEAYRIITANNGETDNYDYKSFLKEYSPNIHQAWHITADEPHNKFFGFDVVERISRSAFSSVWRLTDKAGENYALKVIQIDNLHGGAHIDSFRRGVQSLQYLTNAQVPGAVKIVSAHEIPSSILMSFIEGISLEHVVNLGGYYFWRDGLLMTINICKHLEYSHNLPQGVLHRDIRPSNIMAPNYQWGELEAADLKIDRYETVLLNYDMSWHLNAKGQSLSGNLVESGFYAPELIESSAELLARRTTVDSYGIGMTLFYLYTKQAPPTGGSKSTDWANLLKSKFKADPDLIWKSGSERLRRIIFDATKPKDEERSSIIRIRTRLETLFYAVMGRHDRLSSDIWAEELMFRSTSGEYIVNDDETEFNREIKRGRSISFRGDLKRKAVEIRFMNTATESTDRSRASKLWGDKLKSARQILESGGWMIADSTRFTNLQILLTASISIEDIHQDITRVTKNLNHGLDQIRLD